MARAVELLGGGILGFITGSFLCAPLIAHVFGPTTVTWDASACPPGVYDITSTATSLTDSRSYRAFTQHIRLPKAAIVQDFGDLPMGQYQVTAVARDARGRVFPSATQTVFGNAPSRGRQVVRTKPASPPYSPKAGAVVAPGLAKSTAAAPPAPASSVEPPAAAPEFARLSTDIRDQLLADNGVERLLTTFRWWKSIVLLDVDEDGVADTVLIEWVTGQVWMAFLR